MFTLYNAVLISLVLYLCFCASYTDFKYGKVFNRHVVKFLIAGIFINTVYFSYVKFVNQIETQWIFRYVINILIGCGIAFLMYHNKTWAAGDAKLYVAVLLLIPYNLIIDNSLNIFPGFIILTLIFAIGFIYIVFETFIFVINDIKNKTFNLSCSLNKVTNASYGFDLLRKYLFSYLLASLIIEFLVHFYPSFYSSNRGLILLLNVFLISTAISVFNMKSISLALIVLIFVYVGIRIFIIPLSAKTLYINISSIVTLILVIALRYLGSGYNYLEIPTDKVKSGMVLSFDTIARFKKSKILGLPQSTTETTVSRITSKQAESIKRWKNSKNGLNYIKIVRHVPFAPFISIGTIAFLLIRLFKLL